MASRENVQHRSRVVNRFPRPGLLVGIATTLVVCSLASFLIGRSLAPTDRETLSAAQEPIAVYAAVEKRVVEDLRMFPGQISEGEEATLSPAAHGMVVRRTVAVGDAVDFGSLVGVVSGRPIFFLAGPLPLYRDLIRGDVGDDVAALQNALGASGLAITATGEVDYQTLIALEELFARNGLERAWSDPIVVGDFVAAPGPGTVTQTALVGEEVGEDNPLVTLRYAAPYVKTRVDAITALDLQPGAEVLIRTSESEITGSVTSISAFSEGVEGQKPGHDVTVTAEALEALVGTPVTVSLMYEATDASLAVPITSIREDADGVYVMRDADDGDERVDVNVLRSAEGWVAVRANELREADRVLVSR